MDKYVKAFWIRKASSSDWEKAEPMSATFSVKHIPSNKVYGIDGMDLDIKLDTSKEYDGIGVSLIDSNLNLGARIAVDDLSTDKAYKITATEMGHELFSEMMEAIGNFYESEIIDYELEQESNRYDDGRYDSRI